MQMLEGGVLDPDAIRRLRGILISEGIEESALVERDSGVPLRWFRHACPELDVDQATRLGFALAEQARLTSFGALSVPLVSAGSVAEVVELLSYLPLISTALSSHVSADDTGLTVWLTGLSGDRALDCLAISYCGSALLRILDLLVDGPPTVTLHLSWPASNTLRAGAVESALDQKVFYDAPNAYLYIPKATLDLVCHFSDPIAYRLAITELERKLNDQRDCATSFSEQVRRLLEKSPGKHTSQSVSEKMSISTSTLKRRLSADQTTFRELQQSCLRDRAILLLLTQPRSASEIAHELGYSDLTNFSHAFKRWTGCSPGEFRRARRMSSLNAGAPPGSTKQQADHC
jgi:AraC-like DNA-binding protein